ncbi:MAG: hypothetical protein FWD87_09065 [Spirochaetaceae bacterium]|nr:hypothetical protein [Spirochaetaceae bacterium]
MIVNITTIKNILYLFFASFLLIVFISCTSTEKPVAPPRPQPAPPVEIAPLPPAPANNQPVSDDVFQQTFFDIQSFISTLNKIISDSNYDEWIKHLTQNYINFYSNPATLRQISQAPALRRNNIQLNTLRDYFIYVVVPSRSNVRLDSISIIDDNNIRAYMVIDGESVTLYNLVNVNNNWKIER